MANTITLNFSDFFPYDNDTSSLDFSKDPGSEILSKDNGGIYIAVTYIDREGLIVPQKLLYVGKAQSSSNNLKKRMEEHGKVSEGKAFKDHTIWLNKLGLKADSPIAYSFAVLNDLDKILDIENKLIYKNQPIGNEEGKSVDLSSDKCPYIECKLPQEYEENINLIGYSTLDKFLDKKI